MAGITVDLARRGLTKAQHDWVEGYLKNLRDQGLVEAAEEHRTWCFHVMVSDRYTEWRDGDTVANVEPQAPEPVLQDDLSREAQVVKTFILGQ